MPSSVDAFLLVNWCRLKKSEREIQYLTEAGDISAAALQAAVNACKVGVRQCDVMAELYKVTIGGTPAHRRDVPVQTAQRHGGRNLLGPAPELVDRPLERGEIYYIEQGGVRHRYHSPLSRCIYLGKPSQQMLDTTAIIVEGLEAALAAVKPGATLEQLEDAWRRVIARHGIVKDSRLGYPVGIGFPPTWGELTCSIRKGDRTVMEPGMTFHCIPALWLEDYGLVVSESFVVTDTGARTFANFPRKLFSVEG